MDKPISFAINGQIKQVDCRSDMTVLEWLRGVALLRGTKEGCAEGDCGACSVLIKRYGSDTYLAANSCIMLMGQLEGANLITVEGLAACGAEGHAVQQRMAENGSSQCGFCTPGIVASLAGLLEADKNPSENAVHEALAGNLCRCTGYRPIVEAAVAAAQDLQSEIPTVELPAPESDYGAEESQFYAPQNLEELLALKKAHPKATLLGGGTDISLDVAHARARWERTIYTRNVTELCQIDETEDEIAVGGAVTWQEVLPTLAQYWPSFATLVRRFGSTQIRSMGTMAGNLANASPIGDGAPGLLALNAHLTLLGSNGERTVPLDSFFLDYRKSALAGDEIIASIHIPKPTDRLEFRVYKISKRYDQDISTVCGAFAFEVDEEGRIGSARIAFGGMAAVPKRCLGAEQAIGGKPLDKTALKAAKKAVFDEFSPMTDMRGSAEYRILVAANLLDRVALDLAGETVEVMAL